jgi:hypothetical protein
MGINLRSSHFKIGEFYIHDSTMDLCIEVVNVLEVTPRYTRFQARFWHIGSPGLPYRVSDELGTLKIFTGDAKTWHAMDMEIWCEMERRGYSKATN